MRFFAEVHFIMQRWWSVIQSDAFYDPLLSLSELFLPVYDSDDSSIKATQLRWLEHTRGNS